MEAWLGHKYPCAIVRDRYSGVYSGGAFVAFPLYYWDVPKEVDGSDTECAEFWNGYEEPYGIGETPDKAYWDLASKYLQRYKELKGVINGGKSCVTVRKSIMKVIHPNPFPLDMTYTFGYGSDGVLRAVLEEPVVVPVLNPGGSCLQPIETATDRWLRDNFSSFCTGCKYDKEDEYIYYFTYETLENGDER
jgi:hypothetical protein